MQGTFFGLTVVFHLIVIIIHFIITSVLRLFNIELKLDQEVRFCNSYVNLGIITVVSGFVMFAAAAAVENSVTNDYSTYTYIANYAEEKKNAVEALDDVVPESTNLLATALQEDSSTVCRESSDTPSSSLEGLYLVDYLEATGRDASFEARLALAERLGLQSYSGTPGENQFLKHQLAAEDSFVAAASETCQNQ
jgi:hypothetical protein